MTFQEAQQALCRKLNIDFSDISNNDVFSLDDIKDYINSGARRAWDYKRWDFAEGAKTTISDGSEYLDYPNDFVTGSIFLLKIGGKEYAKKDFKDYLKYKEDDPDGDEKLWAEYKRFYFINLNSYTIGDTIDLWGKLKFTKLSGDSDLLPFSPDEDDEEYSGNDAIINFAYAEALSSEKKKNPNQASIEEKRAFAILDSLWKQFAENRATAQPKNRPLFDVPDFYGSNSSFRIGNF